MFYKNVIYLNGVCVCVCIYIYVYVYVYTGITGGMDQTSGECSLC